MKKIKQLQILKILNLFKEKQVKQDYLNCLFKVDKPVQLDLFTKLPIETIDVFIQKWEALESDILSYWKTHPQLRLSQVLIIFNILPNTPGVWFYKEEIDILLNTGHIKESQITFWGQKYNSDGGLLPEIKFTPVIDLETFHIVEILQTQDLSEKYKRLFTEILKERGLELSVFNLKRDTKHTIWCREYLEVEAFNLKQAKNIAQTSEELQNVKLINAEYLYDTAEALKPYENKAIGFAQITEDVKGWETKEILE